MDKTDKTRFAELMTGLAQTFQTPISATDLDNYWQLLKGFSLPAVEQAIVGYCRSSEGHRFLPKPGELVARLAGGSAGQALLAWSKVLRTIRGVGIYRSVVFDDPLIQAVIWDMGGWQTLCAMTQSDEPFRAREFEKRYTGYLLRPPTAYPRQLLGLSDSLNGMNGYRPLRPPTLIGDEHRALQVLQSGQEAHQLLSFKPLPLAQFTRLMAGNQHKKTAEEEPSA